MMRKVRRNLKSFWSNKKLLLLIDSSKMFLTFTLSNGPLRKVQINLKKTSEYWKWHLSAKIALKTWYFRLYKNLKI
jgi:hypothetical protein